jgi:hypothetical protein
MSELSAFTSQLEKIRSMLSDELAQVRIDPASTRKDSEKKEKELNAQMNQLQIELRDKEIECQSLLSQLKQAHQQQKDLGERLVALERQKHVSPNQTAELDLERKRRIKAEQELDIYRKQGKTTDEKATVNAKRVAVALAQHCLELSEELNKLRQLKPREIQVTKNQQQTAVPKTLDNKPSNKSVGAGWGVNDDDDDLFGNLN